jgi:hypothetical protein
VREAGAHALEERLALGVRGRQVPAGGEDGGDDRERRGVHRERGRRPERVHEHPAQRRAADAGDGEADVEQAVALPQQPRWLQHPVDHPARQPTRGEHEHAVDQGEHQHCRQREGRGHPRQQGEQRSLAHVQGGQHRARRQLVEPRGEGGRQERRQELHGDEQRRRGERIRGLGVDEHRQRDEADVVADRVQRVGGEEPPEGGGAEGMEVGADGGPG